MAQILGTSNSADSSTRTSMASVCALGEHLRTRKGFPEVMHCLSMIRILGAVKYYSQKETFYKWQPRIGDSSQGGSNTQLDDFDHESFKRSIITATAGTINSLMVRRRPEIEQDAGRVRTISRQPKTITRTMWIHLVTLSSVNSIFSMIDLKAERAVISYGLNVIPCDVDPNLRLTFKESILGGVAPPKDR